jgi:anti-sigma factor RsiW
MQCSEISEWMSLHLDDGLSQEQVTQLEVHLARCAACGEEWEALRSLSSQLRAEPMVTPAAGFTARVMQRLQQRRAHRRRLYGGLSVLMGSVGLWSVAIVAVALLFIVLWQPLIRIVVLDVLQPLAAKALSILTTLAQALYSVIHELSVRPTWLLLLGYALLALGLTVLWAHVVLRRREPVPQINSRF